MLRQPALRRLSRPIAGAIRTTPRRTFLAPRSRKQSSRAVENLNLNRLSQESADYHRNRQIFLISGTIAGIISFIYTAYKLKKELEVPHKLDTNLPSTDPLAQDDAASRKVIVRDAEGRELVPTANNVVPSFPRTIQVPSYTLQSSGEPGPTTEYTLVGLGLRTVSFLSIGVYIVGYYVATADIAALQNALIKKVNPIATTLVPGERDQLRAALLNPEEGEKMWEELLAQGIPARSAFRITPVRDTDFPHLRDGLVRSIQAKAGPAQDDSFGEAVKQFRGFFNRGKLPKQKELLFIRDGRGKLILAYDGGSKKEGRPAGRQVIGVLDDERISHALWLNYLAGKKVASEPARSSIVEGIMEFVERPVGTVATQVV